MKQTEKKMNGSHRRDEGQSGGRVERRSSVAPKSPFVMSRFFGNTVWLENRAGIGIRSSGQPFLVQNPVAPNLV
jgi:hypothetical protein